MKGKPGRRLTLTAEQCAELETELGKRIEYRRSMNAISPKKLAARLGCSLATVYRIERQIEKNTLPQAFAQKFPK